MSRNPDLTLFIHTHCQGEVKNIIDILKKYASGAPDADAIRNMLKTGGFGEKPNGWSNQSEITQSVRKIIHILGEGSQIVQCCGKACNSKDKPAAVYIPKGDSKTTDRLVNDRGIIFLCP